MAHESALTTLAEVAIAITGFAGVVAVFGRRSSGHWSVPERNRLMALLVLSLHAMLFSVLPFVLFAVPVAETTTWRVLSLAVLLVRIPFVVALVRVTVPAARQKRSEREVSLAVSAFFLTGEALLFPALAMNATSLGVAWLYLAAIVWTLVVAAISFARLVLVPVGRGPAAP